MLWRRNIPTCKKFNTENKQLKIPSGSTQIEQIHYPHWGVRIKTDESLVFKNDSEACWKKQRPIMLPGRRSEQLRHRAVELSVGWTSCSRFPSFVLWHPCRGGLWGHSCLWKFLLIWYFTCFLLSDSLVCHTELGGIPTLSCHGLPHWGEWICVWKSQYKARYIMWKKISIFSSHNVASISFIYESIPKETQRQWSYS